jgi:TPR repeat protein
MPLRIGFVHVAGAMIGLLLFCLASFPQDNQTSGGEPGIDSSFLSKLNAGIGPAEQARNTVWEDAVYNEAVRLYKKGQYAQAASIYKRACKDFAMACTNLGFMHLKGQGVELSRSLAAEYYKRGCDEGDAVGCTNLGVIYWNGSPRNDSHAVELFERGCRNDDSDGCRDLGFMYRHGYGVSKDETRAVELYGQADQLSHVHHIPFHVLDGLVLVSLSIQGEAALLIVDTGSKRTALLRQFLPPGMTVQPNATVTTMIGSGQAYAVDVSWKLDGREIRLPVLVGDFIFPHGAVGLLGGDILGTFTSVRFDYLNMVLTLED